MSAVSVRECTGECCREFPLGGYDLLSIRQAGGKEGPRGDAFAVASMLIPTGRFVPNRFGYPAAPLFTCMHWDRETKRCRNYINRPRMCSEFPYGVKCGHCQR